MASDSDFPKRLRGADPVAGADPLPRPDPVVDDHVQEAFAPYEDLLPPEVLQHFKDFMSDALATHDVASLLVDRTRTWVPGASSGAQLRDGSPAEVPEHEAPEGKKTGGGLS